MSLSANFVYGVASISRLLKIIGLFCRISSLLWGSFARETFNFQEPTNHSHPIFLTDTTEFLIIGLFCRISSLLQGSYAKETYNFKEPTNCSHPILSQTRHRSLLQGSFAKETYNFKELPNRSHPISLTDTIRFFRVLERCTYMSKETYKYVKRDLHICQKRPTY